MLANHSAIVTRSATAAPRTQFFRLEELVDTRLDLCVRLGRFGELALDITRLHQFLKFRIADADRKHELFLCVDPVSQSSVSQFGAVWSVVGPYQRHAP